jgi:hypothetical protein
LLIDEAASPDILKAQQMLVDHNRSQPLKEVLFYRDAKD